MSRKKPTPPPADEPEPASGAGKRYPSRDRVSVINIPKRFYRALEKYAQQHSTPFDKKSISWAARVLFGPVLEGLGLLDEPEGDEDE